MAQWDIPHDENHRFLDWGPRDHVFKAWCDYFDAAGVSYEVGGGSNSWTIYKHMLRATVDGYGRYSRCCPMDTDL